MIRLSLNHQPVQTADIKCVEALAEIAGIEDFKELGMDMFKVKSAVQGTPVRDFSKA